MDTEPTSHSLQEKAIYHTMNMCNYDVGRKCLIAEGWCPKAETERVQEALKRAAKRSDALVPSILNVVKVLPPSSKRVFVETYSYRGDVVQGGAAHVFQNQYVHSSFPRHCRCLWYGSV